MIKALSILTVLILLIITAFFVFWKKPSVNSKLPIPENILGETTPFQNQPKDNALDLFNQTKDTLKHASQDTLQNLKDKAYNSAQALLDKTFSKQSDSTTVNVNILNSTVDAASQNLYIIDLSKNDGLRTRLLKNTLYQLQFKNVPSGSCLYIGDRKYEISETQVATVEFQKSGNYSIYCEAVSFAYLTPIFQTPFSLKAGIV